MGGIPHAADAGPKGSLTGDLFLAHSSLNYPYLPTTVLLTPTLLSPSPGLLCVETNNLPPVDGRWDEGPVALLFCHVHEYFAVSLGFPIGRKLR